MVSITGRRGFVWYELLLVVLIVAAFAVFMIPRFQRTMRQQNMLMARDILETIHQRQAQHRRECGRFGNLEDVRIEDLRLMAKRFNVTMRDVSESTYVAIATEKKKPKYFLSIDQDSVWSGNLLQAK